MSFPILLATGLLFGMGLGFCVQRAGLCFAIGLGEIFMGRGKRITSMFLVIFVITSLGFLLSGLINGDLGLKPIGEIRGHGFFNLLSGMFFGAGILLSGGCILGTLRQMGEGNMTFLLVFISFIPGMALVVYGLNPLFETGYAVQKMLLPELLGIPDFWVTGGLIAAALLWFRRIIRTKH